MEIYVIILRPCNARITIHNSSELYLLYQLYLPLLQLVIKRTVNFECSCEGGKENNRKRLTMGTHVSLAGGNRMFVEGNTMDMIYLQYIKIVLKRCLPKDFHILFKYHQNTDGEALRDSVGGCLLQRRKYTLCMQGYLHCFSWLLKSSCYPLPSGHHFPSRRRYLLPHEPVPPQSSPSGAIKPIQKQQSGGGGRMEGGQNVKSEE